MWQVDKILHEGAKKIYFFLVSNIFKVNTVHSKATY